MIALFLQLRPELSNPVVTVVDVMEPDHIAQSTIILPIGLHPLIGVIAVDVDEIVRPLPMCPLDGLRGMTIGDQNLSVIADLSQCFDRSA